jgi:hypothetical protein
MANARNPKSVSDKASECRFFLTQMAEYEKQLDTEKFLYCLSAFLSAFRTVAYRLYGVAKSRSGKAASTKTRSRQKSNPYCPVFGCETKQPHMDDSTVEALHIQFGKPDVMALWVKSALVEMHNSMEKHSQENRTFAFLSRLRQTEELY